MRWSTCVLLLLNCQIVWAEIPSLYQEVAQANRIPAKLFYALILNESRSQVTNVDTKTVLPWPWTINHRGTPHYFETRETAYSFMNSLIEEGDENFGVGLGQIHWSWHSHRFEKPSDALDPLINLTVSAQYFREQFEKTECNNWKLAVGCYHRSSQKPEDKEIARQYTNRVLKLWKNI